MFRVRIGPDKGRTSPIVTLAAATVEREQIGATETNADGRADLEEWWTGYRARR